MYILANAKYNSPAFGANAGEHRYILLHGPVPYCACIVFIFELTAIPMARNTVFDVSLL